MDTNHHLPLEIVEIIFDFALGCVPCTEQGRSDSTHILLACALVCKTWLWPARRQLESLCFGRRHTVSIRHTSQELLALSDILQSPLCTLDTGNIQTLTILPDRNTRDVDPIPFFTLLSTLDRIPLPSLHTLSFVNTNLKSSEDDDATSSFASTIRSKIKIIEFLGDMYKPFGDVVYAAHLFPMIETLTAHNTSWDRRRNKRLHSFCPPKSLRRLDVDTLTFLYLAEWLKAKSRHSSISSVSLRDGPPMSCRKLRDCRLPSLLGLLGPNLKGFELALTHPYNINAYKFTKSTSLERLAIQGPSHILEMYLPQLPEFSIFAPHLMTLEIFIQHEWEATLNKVLQRLDQHIKLHPSLQRVILASNRKFDRRGHTFGSEAKKYMPCCVKKGIVEFRVT